MTDNRNDDALDALFASAKTSDPVDDAFMARLMADATEAAENNVPKPAPTRIKATTPFWSRWLPASGLTAATIAGFWMGMVLPSSDFGSAYLATSGATGTELADFVPTFSVSAFEEVGE